MRSKFWLTILVIGCCLSTTGPVWAADANFSLARTDAPNLGELQIQSGAKAWSTAYAGTKLLYRPEGDGLPLMEIACYEKGLEFCDRNAAKCYRRVENRYKNGKIAKSFAKQLLAACVRKTKSCYHESGCRYRR